ncbi:tyrosine-type recombinase/integrase [Gilliamella sp. Pra-s54]|nr:tyrosine-type recombinase/integrase [Gilliamella sp. Pra-s60]MWP29529.1 tyrosine-type recombinase/integrase [Gilliamella sp. Pra-s54]
MVISMKSKINRLLDLNIKNAKAKEKDYYLNDNDGLYLLVKTNESKFWRFKYIHPLTKKQKMISFGKYPKISLADARVLKKQCLDLLEEKIDPHSFFKNEETKNDIEEEKLKNVFNAFLENKRNKVSEKHFRKVKNAINTYILSNTELANKQIKDIKATDFEKVLKVCDGRDLIKRLCCYINNAFDFAITKNFIEYNKMKNLILLFNTVSKKPRPTLPPTELPNILKNINNSNIEEKTKLLMYFQLLTLARPSEAVKCEWSEIDLEKKLWTIKAEKMKMRRDHIVPLPELVIDIIIKLKQSSTNNFLFSSDKTKSGHISLETANNALKRMGYKNVLVAHGFRSLASTALNESCLFTADTIELALAHVDKNTVRATYNNALYLEQRRKMLEWWADYVKNASKFSIF